MSMDSDDEMNIEALEELLGSNTAEMEEIEKNAELDEADAAFFDQLEDQIEDLNSHGSGDPGGTAMNLDFTEPDESVSETNLLEEQTAPMPLSHDEKNPDTTTPSTTETPDKDPVNEESNQNALAETDTDSLRGSLHSMQSQTLDSDDDPELMDTNKDKAIDQLIETLKEEDAMESSATDTPENDSATSLSKSIDVFSKLLPTHSIEGATNLSADLQATAKALAAVSPNFEIGVKGKQSGLFGRFRRSGVAVAPNEVQEGQEGTNDDAKDATEEEGNANAQKTSKSGFFGAFSRGKGEHNQDSTEAASDGTKSQETENNVEVNAGEDKSEADSNTRSGLFSTFRASPKSEIENSTTNGETKNDEEKKEGENTDGNENSTEEKESDENDAKEKNATGSTSPRFFSVFRGKTNNQSNEGGDVDETSHITEVKKEGQDDNAEANSGSGGGIFGVFRSSPKSENPPAENKNTNDTEEDTPTSKSPSGESTSRFNLFRKFGESKKDGQRAMNLSPFEEADSEEPEPVNQAKPLGSSTPEQQPVQDDPRDDGPGMFSYVSRKRDEWNRRGTIDFPKTGPYSERTVRVHKPITEGNFTSVFHATHFEDSETLYVLKRINILSDSTREACEKESIICNVLSESKDCIIPMIGYMVDEEQSLCYMLFPYMHLSLQDEIDTQFAKEGLPEIPPWDEKVALYMFYLLLHAVDALHEIGYSHRNIQIENIYLSSWKRPVLSGFRNAGPLSRSCSSAKDIFEIANTASQSTNMAYRPPELFPGALMVGHDPLNYALVDCWSLGCILYAILYGSTPFECAFDPETGAMEKQECNQLSILADIPFPPSESQPGKWYSDEVKELILFLLERDRAKRPSLATIQAKVSSLLTHGIDDDEAVDVSMTTDMEDFE